MLCNKCGKLIPQERLEILPNTQTCVDCSEEQSVDTEVRKIPKGGWRTNREKHKEDGYDPPWYTRYPWNGR